MTPYQFFTRLQDQLKDFVWPGTSNKIFAFVAVVPSINLYRLNQFVSPTCFIVDHGATNDEEHPEILHQRFQLSFFVENIQDEYGTCAMLGANRTANTSKGVGLLQLEEEVLGQIIDILSLTTKVMLVERGSPKPQIISGNFPLIFRNFQFRILLGVS